MSEMITTTGRSINTITAEIIVLTQQAQASALASACQIGKRLVEAKELVGHGEWGDYLKKEISYSQSTANNFMRLYRELGENPNSQALGSLSPTQALRLLALPEAEREEFAQVNNVANMSTRELEQAIKEKKAAQELLAVAQDTANGLKQQVEDQNAEIQKLNSALNKATAAEKKAKARLDKLKKNPEVPAEMVEKITNEAADAARKEFQSKIDTAEEKAASAEDARMDMEKALVDAQNMLAEAKRSVQTGSADAAAFRVIFDEVQQMFNRLCGYQKKVEISDPELGGKFKKALAAVLDNWKGMVA